MKITFITIEPPSLKKGAPVRIYNLIKQAVAQGVSVDLITLTQNEKDVENLKKELGINEVTAVIEKRTSFFNVACGIMFRRLMPYFSNRSFPDLSLALMSHVKTSKPDIIQFELLHAYYPIIQHVPELKAMGIRLILDAHNVEYNAFVGAVHTFSKLKNLAGRYVSPRLRSIELDAVKNVDHVFSCSEEDKKYFAKNICSEKITVISNGVDCSFFIPEPLVHEHRIIFMGGVYYPPNDDALGFYFHEIHPIVMEKVPDAKMTILGGAPNAWLKNITRNDMSVSIPGLVPDVREYIRKCRVCVSPMREGSGTSLKILEYMGSGKPIVSTSVGVRGISCNEDAIIVANDPKAFAKAVVDLLQNDDSAKKLGENARKIAEELYDWKIIGRKLFEVYNSIIIK